MTKILFTVTSDVHYDQRMQRICSALQDASFDVTLVGRSLSPSSTRHNFTLHTLSCWFRKGKWFYIEFNLRLFWYLLFRKTDIICAIDLDTLLPAYLVSILRGKKLVYDAHEYFTESANLLHRPREQRMWKWLERRMVPSLRYAYTVNQSIADLFQSEYGVPFSVIRNVPYFQTVGTQAKERVLVYQGAVRKERGLEALVRSMKSIDARLIMAGGGALLPTLKQLAQEEGVISKITFTGQLTPEQLTAITASAYIGISPLEPIGANHLYSLSNKFLEYIQLEIPQVAMNFAEYRQINAEYGVAELIDDVTEEQFVKGINTLLHDEIRYQSLLRGTRQAKQDLCWEQEQKVLIALYQHIAND